MRLKRLYSGTEASPPQVDAQLLTVQKLEEKERALQGSLGGVEKELTLRSQALELNKRKVRLRFCDWLMCSFCLCLAMLPQVAQSEARLCSWQAPKYCYRICTVCQALHSVPSTLDSISFYCCVRTFMYACECAFPRG